MIKRIPYVDIAFFYIKANILCRWSNILHIFNWNKGLCRSVKACVTAADLIDSDGKLLCFMLPLSSCDIKISVVSWCRILVAV